MSGRYKVPHFDGKAEADRFFLDAGVPTTFLSTTFFFESFLDFFRAARGEDGTLALSLPMADRALPGIASEDIGRTALAVFERGADLVGRTIAISGENLTGEQDAAAFAKELGEPVVYQALPLEVVRQLPHPGADGYARQPQEALCSHLADFQCIKIVRFRFRQGSFDRTVYGFLPVEAEAACIDVRQIKQSPSG